jgi:hypothetical protein
LPPSVRKWLAFAKSSPQLAEHFNFRDGPPEIEYLEQYGVYSILLQAEGDVHWAVKKSDLSQSDPPIYAYYLDWEAEPNAFREAGLFASSTSAFALDYLLSYLQFPGGYFSVRESVLGASLHELSKLLGPVHRHGHLAIILSPEMLIFGTQLDANWHHGSISVGFRTREGFKTAPKSVKKLYESAFARTQFQ